MTVDEAKSVVESMTDQEVLKLCAFLDLLKSQTKEAEV